MFNVNRLFSSVVAGVFLSLLPVGGGAFADETADISYGRGGRVATLRLRGGVELTMMKIRAGAFTMGSPEKEAGRVDNEGQHHVTLTRDYYLGKYEVTQGQWRAVMGNNPSFFMKGDNYPVERVSWNDARRFCDKLNELYAGKLPKGYHFELPTEAQWEYACRADTVTALNSGKDLVAATGPCPNLNEVGWYEKNSNFSTHPVGMKRPNAWGLSDMHGNVWEWCLDGEWVYGAKASTEIDPVSPTNSSKRTARGGSWDDGARYCRSALRTCFYHGRKYQHLGFRVALVPIVDKK